jgi:hypothetical protein
MKSWRCAALAAAHGARLFRLHRGPVLVAHPARDDVCAGIANDDLNNSRFAQHLLGGNGKLKPMHA